jgi:NitT/TauT family transport system permease protein
MTAVLRSWQGTFALLLCLAALTSLPLMAPDAPSPFGNGSVAVIFLLVAGAALASFSRLSPPLLAMALFVAPHLAVWLLLAGIAGNEGKATFAFFLMVAACWLIAWRCVTVLSGIRSCAF